MEQTDGIGSPAHAGHQDRGQPAFPLEDLRARLAADDALEIPHQERKGMRSRTDPRI